MAADPPETAIVRQSAFQPFNVFDLQANPDAPHFSFRNRFTYPNGSEKLFDETHSFIPNGDQAAQVNALLQARGVQELVEENRIALKWQTLGGRGQHTLYANRAEPESIALLKLQRAVEYSSISLPDSIPRPTAEQILASYRHQEIAVKDCLRDLIQLNGQHVTAHFCSVMKAFVQARSETGDEGIRLYLELLFPPVERVAGFQTLTARINNTLRELLTDQQKQVLRSLVRVLNVFHHKLDWTIAPNTTILLSLIADIFELNLELNPE